MLELFAALQPIVYGSLAVLALLQWRRRPGSGAAWLCLAFSVLAVFFISDYLWPQDETGVGPVLNVPIALLTLFPYSMHRFMGRFVRPARWTRLAPWLTAGVALGALALPREDANPPWVAFWIAAFLLHWLLLTGNVVVRLWRAGRGQPTIARRRMRTMSLGTAVLAAAAVIEGELASRSTAAAVLVQLLAITAAPLLLAGFAPPFALRQWWRRGEEEQLRRVELGLVEAETTAEVADSLVRQARALLGGVGAVLESGDGEVLARIGDVPGSDGSPTEELSSVDVTMRGHRLIVFVTTFTPFFGDEEISRLNALAALGDVALERSKLFYELREQADMLDLAEDAIVARSVEGVITYWNAAAAQRYGWTKEEAIGATLQDLLRVTSEVPMEEIEAALARDGRWEGELQHVTRTGERIIVASRWALWRDGEGSPVQVLEVSNDITKDKESQEELRLARIEADRANTFKTDFLSRISHELRTPLNAILGFAQLLEMEDLEADQLDSAKQITKGGRRLLELINDVLDISRIESGSLRLSLESVAVEAVINDSVELIRPLADDRGIRLRTDIATEAGKIHVRADQQRLGQALLNLLSNAVKYNVEGGLVTVTAVSVGDEHARIGVTDTGPGINEDKISLLFTPFERLGAEQTSIEGTGLGLSLSRSLVQAMGGSLQVDTMKGEGTTFWIELQTAGELGVEEQVGGSNDGTPRALRGSVLYIEDNLSNLTLVQRLLADRAGLEVISAMTGNLGLELAQQHQPDLVLLDLHLPDIEGGDVLARLRRDRRTRDIPVVILSADATAGQVDRLTAAGASHYLTKPIDVPTFLDVIGDLLDRS